MFSASVTSLVTNPQNIEPLETPHRKRGTSFGEHREAGAELMEIDTADTGRVHLVTRPRAGPTVSVVSLMEQIIYTHVYILYVYI